MSWTPLRWLGNISYSYYLMHGLTLKFAVLVLGKVLPLSAGGVGLFLALPCLLFVATLPASLILFLAVGDPSHWHQRRPERRHPESTNY